MAVYGKTSLNLSKFGALLRLARVNSGFRQGDAFVAFMESETGVKLSVASLYRIESGKQEPTLGLFVALNLTLGKELLDREIVRQSVPTNWLKLEIKNKKDSNIGVDYNDEALYWDDPIDADPRENL